jgi:hypothetical protein
MFHSFPTELGANDYLVHSTDFTYDEDPSMTFLVRTTKSGYVRQSQSGAYL